MADTFFAGVCGRSGRPCQIIWSSATYPDRVGIYPDSLLPSKRTIWHVANGGGYRFTPPLTQGGDTFGLGGVGGLILGGLTGSGLFGSDISSDVFRPQTHIALIFARTANRLNVPYIITQKDIDTINRDRTSTEFGMGTIDVGEYIFQALAVVDEEAQVDTELTQAEIEAIESNESASDEEFRKLFDLTFTDNRLNQVERNALGIEYRLDNGGNKSSAVFNLPGIGEQRSPNYRDGSSRVISIDFRSTVGIGFPEGDEPAMLNVGQIVYLTYVAIKEHYMRQVVSVAWSFFATDLPPQCYPTLPTLQAANFRFKEWQISGTTISGEPEPLPVTVSGWRAVESFNVDMNIQALVLSDDNTREIASFLYGDRDGLVTVPYLPSFVLDGGNKRPINNTELLGYINNPGTLPAYQVNLNKEIDGHHYAILQGEEYKKSDWYLTNGSTATQWRYSDIIRHVYYNTHPKALNKRDVDKFGIDRLLADTVQQDINAGRLTSYPFMDDANTNDPTSSNFPLEFLSDSNTLFEPIQPPSSGFFADMQCGVGSSFLLRTPSEFGDVLSEFQIESPIITEPFAKDTKVLIETHFTVGNRGERIVAVEGLGGGALAQSLSVVSEPSKQFSIALHSDDGGHLVSNVFRDSEILARLKDMSYRPDLGNPPIENNDDPIDSQYESHLGYSGMLGDIRGHFPGAAVSIHRFSALDSFIYKTTDASIAKRIGISDDNIEEVAYKIENGKIIIDTDKGWYGRTEIRYSYNANNAFRTMLRLKSGSEIITVVDSISVHPGQQQTLRIDHQWFLGTSIEIDIPSNFEVLAVLIVQLKEEFAEDFLSTSSPAGSSLLDRANGQAILFETSTMSGAYDNIGRLFVFFDDKDGGISCVESDDEGASWYYYYGIVQPIGETKNHYPFIVNNREKNSSFLFYLFGGKIMVKRIDYGSFVLDDALLVERFEQDIFTPASNGTPASESTSSYSSQGEVLRYRSVSYAAAGDLNDEYFLDLTGRNLENNVFQPFEERNTDAGKITLRKNPVAIGPMTAFANNDQNDLYFSAYRRDNGEMKLFFMAPVIASSGGGLQLQCHFSTDDGINWYDNWEVLEYGHNRFRTDNNRKTQFIDYSAGNAESDVFGTDPQESQQEAPFGINVHWSRLKRHKIEGGDDLNSESQVLEINSPYLFYLPSTKDAFLFYVYEECLLCKIFGDELFDISLSNMKTLIEQQTRSYFIDGNLKADDLKEEIHRYYHETYNEIMGEGNIIFPYQYAIDTFDDSRAIPAQRVCAYELLNGTVRVMYKNKNRRLHAALWTGNAWFQEDLLGSTSFTPTPGIPDNAIKVVGGFNGTGFGEV